LRKSELKVDSPYNTYRFKGLPPGPICSPGRSAIWSALNPDDTEYFYFVKQNRRRHHFSKTHDEHQAAVTRYREWRDAGR
jgi:UPF0755 protein